MSAHPGRKKREVLGLRGYNPKLSKTQLEYNHRHSVHEYYVRNLTRIREKRRIQMAEKKAEKQRRRRQWDPPKKSKPPIESYPSNGDAHSSADLLDLCTPSIGGSRHADPGDADTTSGVDAAPNTVASPTSEELAVSNALIALAQPDFLGNKSKPTLSLNGNSDSVLAMALLLDGNSANDADEVRELERNAIHEPHILADVQNTLAHPREDCVEHKTLGPIEDTPLSSGIASVSMHEVNLERSGCVGERVQASQIRIAELNSAALTAPTASERASWNRPQLR
ncbi:hypothetical protein C8J57DRAFT_1477461, partial [Mycena rebaudengoi]